MKVVKKTGLVPVHSTASKEIFGVSPADAAKGVKNGTLFLIDIPEDIETITISDGPANGVVENDEPDSDVVDIPEGWESLHWAKIVVLAKDILGVDELPEHESKKPLEVARETVQAEVDRRLSEDDAENLSQNEDGSESQSGEDQDTTNQPAIQA